MKTILPEEQEFLKQENRPPLVEAGVGIEQLVWKDYADRLLIHWNSTFSVPTSIAAILYFLPVDCPLLSPEEWPSANHAEFLWQVRLSEAISFLA